VARFNCARSVPSIYFDWVSDRFRHRRSVQGLLLGCQSIGAEFFDPADPAEHELTTGPKLPPLTSTAKSRSESGGRSPERGSANVERDYLGVVPAQSQRTSRGKLLHDWASFPVLDHTTRWSNVE